MCNEHSPSGGRKGVSRRTFVERAAIGAVAASALPLARASATGLPVEADTSHGHGRSRRIDGHNSHTNVCSGAARAGFAFWCGYELVAGLDRAVSDGAILFVRLAMAP